MSSTSIEKLGLEITQSVKICTKCEIEKPVEAFPQYRNKGGSAGTRGRCKECGKKYIKSWYEANHAEQLEYRKRQRQECQGEAIEEKRAYMHAYYLAHKEEHRAAGREWERSHPDKKLSWVRLRQARKLQAVPTWLSPEQRQEMSSFYALARSLSASTGVRHAVDHIIPLVGREISNGEVVEVRGLHVPWNLQVIPASENCRKSNKFLGEVK